MRWWLIAALPVCVGWMVPGTAPEIGVLSCSLGHAIDPQTSDQTSASETREMLCSFKSVGHGPVETYAGVLKSISVVGTLPENGSLLWLARAPAGMQPAAGLLQQGYSVDAATPPGHSAPLIGNSNSEITLHAMSDKEMARVSLEKPSMPRYIITSVDLKLIITTS
jgi:hypothetical protein